jgi:hypothetical protein
MANPRQNALWFVDRSSASGLIYQLHLDRLTPIARRATPMLLASGARLPLYCSWWSQEIAAAIAGLGIAAAATRQQYLPPRLRVRSLVIFALASWLIMLRACRLP